MNQSLCACVLRGVTCDPNPPPPALTENMSIFSISYGRIKPRPPDRPMLSTLVTYILLVACITVVMVTKYDQLTSAIPSIIAVPLQRSRVGETTGMTSYHC
ncbi:Hypp1677 [Branchiostoma lanceolatum]|uniref:Hypp1677 protein n=1 Tax=Branchiostoma lanceolatum TaxID=7740 RepID=A0A8J9ZKZ3_BRALA|nr:Hypp1677 [Branchiostoma lanceolatum]